MAHSDLVQSVIRASDILVKVSRSRSGVALREVSDSLGMKSSTAHNLLRTLVAEGLLEKTLSPPRYWMGPLLDSLCKALRAQSAGRRRARKS